MPKFFEHPVAIDDRAEIFLRMVCGDPEIVCHCIFLLCGKFFDGFIGVRQPNVVDVVQNIFARLMVVFAIALQDFVTARRVFERHERNIRAFLCADEEDERFFSHHALVVVHPSHAMMQRFSFTDKVSRTSCDHADKGTFLGGFFDGGDAQGFGAGNGGISFILARNGGKGGNGRIKFYY